MITVLHTFLFSKILHTTQIFTSPKKHVWQFLTSISLL